jgi:PAS domain S-box-containing protein
MESAVTAQDPTGRIIYANPAAARLIGYDSVEALLAAAPGAAVARWEMFDEGGAPLGVERLPNRRVLAGAEELSETLRFRSRETGRQFWVEMHTTPIRAADGSLASIVTTWDDVTERRRVEEGDRRLAALISTTDDAIISKTLDGTITSWNPGAERLFGWTAEEMVGHSITRIVPEDKRTELKEILTRLSRGEKVSHHETQRVTRDGRRLDISVSISPISDKRGRVIGAAKIARDITARRTAERFADAFLADLAHDLNNPLAAARVHVQLLRRRLDRGQLDTAKLLTGLSEIETSLNRVARRMGELGDVARLRLGEEIDLRRVAVDLVALVEARAEHFRSISQHHTIALTSETSSLLGYWDRDRLERVIDNLLSNAIKFTPHGGTVSMQLFRDGGSGRTGEQAVLTIKDEGVGIPPTDLPIIFDRFQRGTNVIGRFAGTGIGLAGVKQILGQHGGTIDVQSEEGVGTIVTVCLPLSDPPAGS